MARTRVIDSSGDDLPDLATFLSLTNKRIGAEPQVRRSPRKQQPEDSVNVDSSRLPTSYEAPTTSFNAKQENARASTSLAKQGTSRVKTLASSTATKPKARTTATKDIEFIPIPTPRTILGEIPLLRPENLAEYDPETETARASSNNRSSPQYRQTSGLKLTHVDSLSLHLSKLAVGHDAEDSDDDVRQVQPRRKYLPKESKDKAGITRTSRFVLKEARCNDDSQDSALEDDEDEETDLSGFIVDDDAELSFHDSVGSDSDFEEQKPLKGKVIKPPVKRLQRGSPVRRALFIEDEDSEAEGSNKENEARSRDNGSLEDVMRNLDLDNRATSNAGSSSKEIEVVDLTSSPVSGSSSVLDADFDHLDLDAKATTMPKVLRSPVKKSSRSKESSSQFEEDFDAILKFSPPRLYSPTKKTSLKTHGSDSERLTSVGIEENDTIFNTTKSQGRSKPRETTTPPQTPTKLKLDLKSPSKLLSPSKSTAIPNSPHRQSVDAFWDLETINTWNDTYSPKKAPLTSGRTALEKFMIWEDSDSDNGNSNSNCEEYTDNPLLSNSSEDNSSLPSPCSSPTKTLPAKSRSPSKPRPKTKNLEKEAKNLFLARRDAIAATLLTDLDANVTEGKLGTLAASTGGVKITWSKTLRSTAGRANWRRTVSSPSKKTTGADSVAGAAAGKVSHYATIELAEKIVDSEPRLVNTLAHEFCHLANFMVSGVRDQPHGREFKCWAAKATKYLKQNNGRDTVRGQVEVTTKHAYVISYKYLWVCVGRSRDGDGHGEEGCGGEYGRHSRSIDVARQRCGRCKGVLVQVRPGPRGGSPVKGAKKAGKGLEGVVGGVDAIELSD